MSEPTSEQMSDDMSDDTSDGTSESRPRVHSVVPPLPDPGDPLAADFYDWLAAHARAAQTPAERSAVMRSARQWGAAASAARRAVLEVEAERAAEEALDAAAMADASPRRHVRLVRERPERFYTAAATGALVADVCARKSRAGLGGLVPLLELGAAAGDGRDLRDTPVAAWVALPADLPDARYLALPVEGASMEPALRSGDILLVQLGVTPAAGTVVVARHPDDGYLVKRLDRVTADAYELAPSNPRYPRVRLPRDPALVLGRVAMVWRSVD